MEPTGWLECGADHWTAPMLCVISCSWPSGHQPSGSGPGAAVSGYHMIDVSPPLLWMLPRSGRCDADDPSYSSPTPFGVPEDSVSAMIR